MFDSPYRTDYGSKFNLSRVELALQKADIMKQLTVIDPELPWLVAVIGKDDSDVPSFIHPVTLNDPNRGKKVVVDLRPYGRMLNILEDRIKIAAFGGAALTVNRAILQYHWTPDTVATYAGMSDIPVAVYSRWLSDQIARGLAVDPVNQQRLSVVLAYFYYSLFEPTDTFTKQEAVKLAPKISRILRLEVGLVLDYIPEIIPSDITTLIALLSSGDYGMRLQNLNKGIFYQITTNGFFGVANAKEVLAVAIEFPPTFLAVLYASINDKGYNKTPLQLAAKPFDRQNAFKYFNQAFDGLVGSIEDN